MEIDRTPPLFLKADRISEKKQLHFEEIIVYIERLLLVLEEGLLSFYLLSDFFILFCFSRPVSLVLSSYCVCLNLQLLPLFKTFSEFHF